MVILLGLSLSRQHWELGVLRWSKLYGYLSFVDCGWVWQQSHELIITELGLGVGRFGWELLLEADFFCAHKVMVTLNFIIRFLVILVIVLSR